jgi:hypothetical protein
MRRRPLDPNGFLELLNFRENVAVLGTYSGRT